MCRAFPHAAYTRHEDSNGQHRDSAQHLQYFSTITIRRTIFLETMALFNSFCSFSEKNIVFG